MNRWTSKQAQAWYDAQPWITGCNFLPSTAINQLEMFQEDSYDPETINRELGWARSLGFNTMRVYLHDLVWRDDKEGFIRRIDDFLGIAEQNGMRIILVLFDDCHRPHPESGPQPLPVSGVHNSGWMRSPGVPLVAQFEDGTVSDEERTRLKNYVQEVLTEFDGDSRVLMWDLYNEPYFGKDREQPNALLQEVWPWAWEVRPSQPLTSCTMGSAGPVNTAYNGERSDITTFHCYAGTAMEGFIKELYEKYGRPIICTEYMAREHGTTFQHTLPILKKHKVGAINWGLVVGKSQTHFNWETVKDLDAKKERGEFLKPGDPVPEPELWFHDIFRMDGTPFDPAETDFIRKINAETSRPA